MVRQSGVPDGVSDSFSERDNILGFLPPCSNVLVGVHAVKSSSCHRRVEEILLTHSPHWYRVTVGGWLTARCSFGGRKRNAGVESGLTNAGLLVMQQIEVSPMRGRRCCTVLRCWRRSVRNTHIGRATFALPTSAVFDLRVGRRCSVAITARDSDRS